MFPCTIEKYIFFGGGVGGDEKYLLSFVVNSMKYFKEKQKAISALLPQ